MDVFLTNRPHLWKPTTCVFKSLVKSDHMAVMISTQILAKPVRKTVYIRDVREHRKLEMDRKLAVRDWSDVYDCDNDEDMVKAASKLKEDNTIAIDAGNKHSGP